MDIGKPDLDPFQPQNISSDPFSEPLAVKNSHFSVKNQTKICIPTQITTRRWIPDMGKVYIF